MGSAVIPATIRQHIITRIYQGVTMYDQFDDTYVSYKFKQQMEAEYTRQQMEEAGNVQINAYVTDLATRALYGTEE